MLSLCWGTLGGLLLSGGNNLLSVGNDLISGGNELVSGGCLELRTWEEQSYKNFLRMTPEIYNDIKHRIERHIKRDIT